LPHEETVKTIRKSEMTAPVSGFAEGTPPAKRTLLSLLQLACGSPAAAHDVLDRALAEAGRTELPATPGDLVDFVRAHLLDVLSGEIGPRLTVALVEDLVTELAGSSSGATLPAPPPSAARAVQRLQDRSELRRAPTPAMFPAASAPSRSPSPPPAYGSSRLPAASPEQESRPLGVVLVDGDRVGRTAVARALVRERWDVTVIDSEQDVAMTLDTAFVDAAVVDTSHEAAHAILEALVRRNPHVVLVLRRAPGARARIDMARLPAKRFDVISSDAPVQDLVRLVRRAGDSTS
jgi:hypothetical protein